MGLVQHAFAHPSDGRADSKCCAQTAARGSSYIQRSCDGKQSRHVIRICSTCLLAWSLPTVNSQMVQTPYQKYCSTTNIAATLQVQRLKRGGYSDYTYSDCACDKMCCGYMSVNLQQPVTLQLVLLTEGICCGCLPVH